MAAFEDYNKKREQLQKKLQSLKEFEKTDKVVGLVFEISRNVVSRPGDYQSINTLLKQGRELSGYFGYLECKANEHWGEYKMAEVAWKNIKDGLLLAYKGENMNTTEARAQASREMSDAEVDAIAREQRFKNFATAAKMCEQIISFIQTTLKNKQTEYKNTGTADGRGGNIPR